MSWLGETGRMQTNLKRGNELLRCSRREFDLYGLSLSRGPNFSPFFVQAAWKTRDKQCVGAVLAEEDGPLYGYVAMRRTVDQRFALTGSNRDMQSHHAAEKDLFQALRPDDPPDMVPPGMPKRPALLSCGGRVLNKTFELLTETITHMPAIFAINEVYLAMPRPDDNFVSDFQTSNFDSRLFELYLVAAFREQGIEVAQDQISPDFLLKRGSHLCYVEAVTANTAGVRAEGYTSPTHAPESRDERLLGAPAIRFAKTLRSKLQKNYEQLPHVNGKPFAIAIADFHAPSSMVWSREALPSYLYGTHAQIPDEEGVRRAFETRIDHLHNRPDIPAGLFTDKAFAHLSAVLFTNAATLAKFNRMGFLTGWQPPGVSMIRRGIIFDRMPGALDPIPFSLDVLSEEYANLWPWGEAWCQELDVFHNPNATHPLSFELIPGGTHWFEEDGEILCTTMWEKSVLSSVTILDYKKS